MVHTKLVQGQRAGLVRAQDVHAWFSIVIKGAKEAGRSKEQSCCFRAVVMSHVLLAARTTFG